MKSITQISFDASSKAFILEVLGKKIDPQGYVVEAQGDAPVLTPDGQPLHIDEFAGVRKGSEIFFKSDLPSVLDAVKQATAATEV